MSSEIMIYVALMGFISSNRQSENFQLLYRNIKQIKKSGLKNKNVFASRIKL